MTAATFQSLAILLLSGIAVGAFLDGVRLLRDRVPFIYAKYWIFVELIGWGICGGITFYLLYSWQDGHWRWVNFFAQIIGIFLYDRYIFQIMRLVMRIIVYSIITPIKVICNLVWKFIVILFVFLSLLLKLLKFHHTK